MFWCRLVWLFFYPIEHNMILYLFWCKLCILVIIQKAIIVACTKAEYQGMVSTFAELTWISYLLQDIGFRFNKPLKLYCDNNMGALHLFISLMFHSCTKHIQVDYHFLWEKVAFGEFNTCYFHSSQEIACLYQVTTLSNVSSISWQTESSSTSTCQFERD